MFRMTVGLQRSSVESLVPAVESVESAKRVRKAIRVLWIKKRLDIARLCQIKENRKACNIVECV